MSNLWAAAFVTGAVIIGVAKTVIGNMVQEEARTRLGRIPFALIRLASRRVPADMREDLTTEWTAELDFLLTGTDGMPLTRLVRGIRYSAGLLRSAREITAGLTRKDTNLVGIAVFAAATGAGAIALGIISPQAIAAGPTWLIRIEQLTTGRVGQFAMGGSCLILAMVLLQAWRYKRWQRRYERWLRGRETTEKAMPDYLPRENSH